MALGDDVVNAILNPATADIESLKRRLNKIDADALKLGGFLAEDGGLNVPSITAGSGAFSLLPTGALYLRRDAEQTISNNTFTDVIWDNVVSSAGSLFKQDPDNTTRILISPQVAGRVFYIGGRQYWNVDATGYRITRVTFSEASIATLFYNGAPNELYIMPFGNFFYYSAADLPQYFTTTVKQTSGGNLALFDMSLCVFLVT